jgi:hypothetical protein
METLYQDGDSLESISRKFDVSHPLVARTLRARGIAIRRPGLRIFTEDQEAEVLAFWREGHTMVETARRFGCSIEPIKRILRQAGHRRRDHRPKKVLPENLHSEIVDAYNASPEVSCNSLGRLYGTHSNEIKKILLLHGVEVRDARSLRGPASPAYKNGCWTGPDGYVRVLVQEDDPMASVRIPSGRYALEHRLVMSRHLGRPLTKDERVHHKNGVKDDNRIENLEVWSYAHPPGQRVSDKPPHCPTCTCESH